GQTQVFGGVLSVSKQANLGTAQSTVLLDGGALQVTGIGGASFDQQVSLGAQGGRLDVLEQDQVASFNGGIDGDGSLTLSGAGRVILTRNNTYAGPTFIANTGGLQLGTGATL